MTAGAVWKNLVTDLLPKRTVRSLVLRETLSLGEKRFVAVIECDGEKFLVGGSSQSVNLISRLKREPR